MNEPVDEPVSGESNPVGADGIPVPIRWAMGGFFVTAVAIFAAGSLLQPDVSPGFAPTPGAQVLPDGTFRITVQVKGRETWVPVDLSLGRAVPAQAPGDLLLQRYRFQAPQGAAEVGGTTLAEANPPSADGWARDIVVDGELQNPALARWYHYGWQSHLLEPRDTTFAVRLHGGGSALFQIESYYCQPEGSGCMTLHYRLVR